MTDSGTLTVRVNLGRGAYPIEGATVLIQSEEETNAAQSYSVRTDRDGRTETVRLAAPRRELSLRPSPESTPYASYSIEITREGFYPMRIREVAIFPGVAATLPVNLIPLAEYDAESVFPRGNLRLDTSEGGVLGGGAV